MAGKGVAEAINPTEENEYWSNEYRNRPYYRPGSDYEDYAPAYRHGYTAASQSPGKSWDEMETNLERDWDNSRGQSTMDWDRARQPARCVGSSDATNRRLPARPEQRCQQSDARLSLDEWRTISSAIRETRGPTVAATDLRIEKARQHDIRRLFAVESAPDPRSDHPELSSLERGSVPDLFENSIRTVGSKAGAFISRQFCTRTCVMKKNRSVVMRRGLVRTLVAGSLISAGLCVAPVRGQTTAPNPMPPTQPPSTAPATTAAVVPVNLDTPRGASNHC